MSPNDNEKMIALKQELGELFTQFYRGDLKDSSVLKKKRVAIAQLLTQSRINDRI
jgi:ribosomal protein L29